MLNDFKAFILRGNVVDLAVGVAVGAAFANVVTSFTENLITPLINIFGNAEAFQGLSFEVGGQEFGYGDFLDALISFLITAAVLFFVVVRPVNHLVGRNRTEPEVQSPTRSCPECLSKIPTDARRCAFCTSEVAAA